GYANAILRRLSASPIDLPSGNPAVYYSLPPELYGYLRKWYGPAEAAALGEAFLCEDVRVTARVNRLQASAASVSDELQAAGIGAEAGRYCAEALLLDLRGHAVRELPAWQDGRLTIQDEAAMLVGYAASPQPGQTVIDLCAAPGGKTCHLAERSDDRSRILATDINPERLKLVTGQAQRLGLTSISCQTGDATGAGMDPRLAGTADLVLADVPCSGLGLLGRKPEIRLTMTHEKMIGLYPLQQSILEYAATLVCPGGVLIYSTCTINPAENIGRVQAFLEESGNRFRLEDLTPHMPAAVTRQPDLAQQAREGWLQLLPHRHQLDGFFIARLRRT
ncbi:MAG TPA: 16S rRNA (cytosine(967)-C(5))-methyltransferase RsmB, partial [Clostridiales bacterium]|nr:16S rRNA (cytosine(967)-C(5))-methyltransferase RsmB [Clostridiales bacterium]